jgi:hypothetical protein
MEIILILLFAFFKFYFTLGCIFTLLSAVVAFSSKTENDFKVGEIFAMMFFYPFIIYYLLNPTKNNYE